MKRSHDRDASSLHANAYFCWKADKIRPYSLTSRRVLRQTKMWNLKTKTNKVPIPWLILSFVRKSRLSTYATCHLPSFPTYDHVLSLRVLKLYALLFFPFFKLFISIFKAYIEFVTYVRIDYVGHRHFIKDNKRECTRKQ